jgi:hypothetical protein
MLRRSFRLGLRLGLIIGVIAAIAKLVQSRRSASAPDAGWPAVQPAWTPPPAPSVRESAVMLDEPVVASAVVEEAIAVSEAPAFTEVAEEPASPEPAVGSVSEPTTVEGADKKPARRPAKTAAKATTSARVRKAAKPATLWVEPSGGTCPSSHPVKAKMASRIFHLPGMFAYERTRPDRCYADAEAAEGDGFTRAKR